MLTHDAHDCHADEEKRLAHTRCILMRHIFHPEAGFILKKEEKNPSNLRHAMMFHPIFSSTSFFNGHSLSLLPVHPLFFLKSHFLQFH